jgi:hypothetical protein
MYAQHHQIFVQMQANLVDDDDNKLFAQNFLV